MNVTAITAAAICISMVTLSVKNIREDMGQMISIGGAVLVLAALVPYINEVVCAIKEFSSYSNMGVKYLQPILKITGIAYISQIGAQMCSESGENSLAARVEMAGKIAICTVAIPVAREAFIKIIGILT